MKIHRELFSLFPQLFFEIFPIKNVPLTASWRYVTGKRSNLLTHDIVNMIFLVKKLV